MDQLATLAVAMGSAWTSGINVYATVLTLGLLQRFGLVHLPGGLDSLSHTWVLAVAGFMYLIEFVADKIPAVDTAWDAVHTFVRVPAGAIMAASAFSQTDPVVQMIATLVGGGVALSSHGAKAATRVAANTSPEPFSNIALSLGEDVLTVGTGALLATNPLLVLGIVLTGVVVALFLIHRIVRALRGLFRRLQPRTA